MLKEGDIEELQKMLDIGAVGEWDLSTTKTPCDEDNDGINKCKYIILIVIIKNILKYW